MAKRMLQFFGKHLIEKCIISLFLLDVTIIDYLCMS